MFLTILQWKVVLNKAFSVLGRSHKLFMIEKMVNHTFKKYCGVNTVIFKVCLTTSAKQKNLIFMKPKESYIEILTHNER